MNWRIRLIAITYDVLIGGISGLALLWLILLTAVPNGSFAWLLVPAMFVIFFGSIFVHELGHLIAALAMGLEVFMFASWPLKVARIGRTFYLRHFDLPPPMLGHVAAYPTSLRLLFCKFAVLLSTAPLVNLVVATFSLKLAYEFNENLPWTSLWERFLVPRNWTAILLFATALTNFYFFFVNLRPIPFKMFCPDGAALISMARARPLVIQTWLVEALSTSSRNGKRPGDLNREFIDYLLVARDASEQGMLANFFGYYHFLDKGQTNRAGDLIDLLAANREKYASTYQSYAVLEAAYFEGRHRRNAAAARRWLDQTPKDGVEPQTYLRAVSAVLLAEERYEEAAVIASAALLVLPRSADPGGAIAEREWLESILAESQSQIGQARS